MMLIELLTPNRTKRSKKQNMHEHQLAAWLDDQRMGFALGELSAEKVDALRSLNSDFDLGVRDVMTMPPSDWTVGFVKALVREFTGRSSLLPARPTWAQLAAEARTKIVNRDGHINPPGRWLDDDSEGYFIKWTTDFPDAAVDHPEE